MKKILCLCLTVLMLVCCFGFIGCEKEDDINYTAEKPILNFETEWIEEFDESENKTYKYWTYKGFELVGRFNYYKDFSEYYSTNLKDNKLYLFSHPNEDLRPMPPDEQGGYNYFKNKQTGEMIVFECYKYYDSSLGVIDCGEKAGCSTHILYFCIFIKPIESAKADLIFEFGKLTRANGSIEKYINVYSGEECFATCYFDNNVYISQEWYENYLKTNLVYGDEL